MLYYRLDRHKVPRYSRGMAAESVADHFLVVFEAPDTGGNSHLVLQKKWLKAKAREVIGPSEEDTTLKQCVQMCVCV